MKHPEHGARGASRTGEGPLLHFHGGQLASFGPLLVFLVCCMGLLLQGALTERAMILAAMAGITTGVVLARERAVFCDAIFTLMTNRVVVVAVICWLWAGAFGGLLRESGLVNGIIWLAAELQVTGRIFTLVVFLGAGLFAVSVGTGMGTIIGFTAVMYPAGVALGAEPAVLMGAILSGAAFGDNLAPVSDTTIVSAVTQEADIGGVVRSRLRYALSAGGVAALLFLIMGGGGTTLSPEQAAEVVARVAQPAALVMLFPAAAVFALALSGRPFLLSLSAGILLAIATGWITGVLPFSSVLRFGEDGAVAGALASGAGGMIEISMLALLLVTNIGIFEAGGANQRVMDWLDRSLAKSKRGAELAIIALISLLNLCVSVNTVAMITAGPLVNDFRKRHGIGRYRAANLLDTISCTFPYALPYAATTVAALVLQRSLAEADPAIPVTSWLEMVTHFYYAWTLFPLMLLAAITGWGRGKPDDGARGSAEDGASCRIDEAE